MLRYHQRQKNYQEGWIAHKFKERFKVWPNSLKDTAPIIPDDKFYNWIRSRNIARAKAIKKAENTADQLLKRGGELIEQHRLRQDSV